MLVKAVSETVRYGPSQGSVISETEEHPEKALAPKVLVAAGNTIFSNA